MLLPQTLQFADDPAFHVPALGCNAVSGQQEDTDQPAALPEALAQEVKAEAEAGVCTTRTLT